MILGCGGGGRTCTRMRDGGDLFSCYAAATCRFQEGPVDRQDRGPPDNWSSQVTLGGSTY
jgi:hypothetical protein